MNETKRIQWIIIATVLITVIFILLFHSLYNFVESKSRDSLIIESAKTLLQLAGVAALGGWLKFLYDGITEQRRLSEKIKEQERASQEATNEIRKGLLNDLIDARSRVEKVRIRYRLEETLNPLEQYRTTILEILEARLNMSRIWNAIETSSYLFAKYHHINNNIRKMKLYLDELINEYEIQINDLRKLSKEELIPQLHNLKVFGDFIKNAETSDYGKNFLVEAYRPAVKEIRKEVLLARQIKIEEDSDQ